jgi:C4-dicarboxylate transporter DctQ subunit
MITRIGSWLSRLANFILATVLAAIFVTFLAQIFARYAPKIATAVPASAVSQWLSTLEPIGWTVNLISLLWVWLIFFGCAFVVKERDHVVFDVLVQAMPPWLKLFCKLFVAVVIVCAMIWSLGPVWDAIFGSRLMELKKIQTVRIPITGDRIAMKWLFAPYFLLMVVLIVRYSYFGVQLIKSIGNHGPLTGKSGPET